MKRRSGGALFLYLFTPRKREGHRERRKEGMRANLIEHMGKEKRKKLIELIEDISLEF